MKHDNEYVTVRLNRWARFAILTGVVLFLAAFEVYDWTILRHRRFGWVAFALWAVLVASLVLGQWLGSQINLHPDEFTVRQFLFTRGARFRWSDTGPFVPRLHVLFPMVLFDGDPYSGSGLGRIGKWQRASAKRRFGYSNVLLAWHFGRSASALAETLNEWRLRHSAAQQQHEPGER